MPQLWTATDFAPRNGQDSNQIYSSSQPALPQYSDGNAISYYNASGNHHYSSMSPTYVPPYPTSYLANQDGAEPLMYMQPSAAASMSYHTQPPPRATLPSQHHTLSQHAFYASAIQPHRGSSHHSRVGLVAEVSLADTEEQESPNHDTMRSEPISPALDGYPNVGEFDDLMKQYVKNLSPKKQDKALIHAKRAANIKAVLVDKKTTSVESAQFRFWVKKMFTLEPRDPSLPPRKKKICHEGKPVAIREKLFKILTRAHKQCQHGGRDKTSAQVRRVYSWVPKELISRFVKLCPTCQVRRGTNRSSPPTSEHSVGTFLDPQSPQVNTCSKSRRESLATSTGSSMHSPIQMSRFPDIFQQQNRWMSPVGSSDKQLCKLASMEAAASAMVNMNMNSPLSPQELTSATSKFAEDPDPPYLGRNNVQHSNGMNSHYHHNSFHNIHNLHDFGRANHNYRPHRGNSFKRDGY